MRTPHPPPPITHLAVTPTGEAILYDVRLFLITVLICFDFLGGQAFVCFGLCVYVCVCVCVRAHVCVCVFFIRVGHPARPFVLECRLQVRPPSSETQLKTGFQSEESLADLSRLYQHVMVIHDTSACLFFGS